MSRRARARRDRAYQQHHTACPNAERQAQAQTPSSAANHLAIPAHRGGPCRRDQTPGKSGRFGAALAGAGHSLQKAS